MLILECFPDRSGRALSLSTSLQIQIAIARKEICPAVFSSSRERAGGCLHSEVEYNSCSYREQREISEMDYRCMQVIQGPLM